MVYLNFNEADQTAYFTLDEGRQYFSEAFTHYLCVLCKADGTTDLEQIDLAQVLEVVNENQRTTEVLITTIGLENSGEYAYYIYGQNSSTNIDTDNNSVVGIVEQGSLIVRSEVTPFVPINGQNNFIIID
jgi:hypothetical protein